MVEWSTQSGNYGSEVRRDTRRLEQRPNVTANLLQLRDEEMYSCA